MSENKFRHSCFAICGLKIAPSGENAEINREPAPAQAAWRPLRPPGPSRSRHGGTLERWLMSRAFRIFGGGDAGATTLHLELAFAHQF
jgi:hypothetical protein